MVDSEETIWPRKCRENKVTEKIIEDLEFAIT